MRVGPYNVNPEIAIDKASVITHEYGHSLGLPDFYSTGSRDDLRHWTLMAEDHSQNMDVFGKQELGWLVPRVLEPGADHARSAAGRTRKLNTHRIDWETPDGKPYTLTGAGVHNGEAYVAKLPSRQIIDPDKVAVGHRHHVWWSQAGNDFGCAPTKGHNFDIYLPELADVPAGTTVTLTSSRSGTSSGTTTTASSWPRPTAARPTSRCRPPTATRRPRTQNPNANGCQAPVRQRHHRLERLVRGRARRRSTASSASTPTAGFVADSYDLSALAGQERRSLRFTYATDPGLARPGWFIDDLKVTAGDQVIYSTDFESGATTRASSTAAASEHAADGATQCTKGWQYVDAVDGDRRPTTPTTWRCATARASTSTARARTTAATARPSSPACSLVYTDETHGYGNFGTDDPPAQTPLDSSPSRPPDASPNLDDAAFTAGAGRNRFSDAGPGRTSTTTPTRRTRTATGASPSTACRSRSTAWPATTSRVAPRRRRAT